MVFPFHVWANHRTFATRNQEKHILPFLNTVNKNSNPLNDMSYEKNDDDNGDGSDDGFICICKEYE